MAVCIREHETQSAAMSGIEDRMEAAEDIFAVSVPSEAISQFEPYLSAAVERGVLVLLLVSETESVENDRPVDRLATAIRRFDRPLPTMGYVDGASGWTGDHRLLTGETVSNRSLTVIENRDIAHGLYAQFLGVHWEPSTEVAVVEPQSLPATYGQFQRAVIDATLWMREGRLLRATAHGRDVETGDAMEISGTIVNSRQSYVYPITAEIYGTNGLVVETDEGTTYSLGGEQAYLEDIEVAELTLRAAEPESA